MSTSCAWPAKLLALHLLTVPDGSTDDHSEVSMLISQNYCHGPEKEKHKLPKMTRANVSIRTIIIR